VADNHANGRFGMPGNNVLGKDIVGPALVGAAVEGDFVVGAVVEGITVMGYALVGFEVEVETVLGAKVVSPEGLAVGVLLGE